MKRIYVSIPITGKDYNAQVERAESIRREYEKEGHKVSPPLILSLTRTKATPTAWVRTSRYC